MPDRGERVTPGAIVLLLLVACLPALVFLVGVTMLPFLLTPAVMLIPGYLFRGQGPAPEPPGPGDGGGDGPPEPDDPPEAPRGGLPLPDAGAARVRLRDHDRPDRLPGRPRRPAREPGPQPSRLPQRA